LQPSLPRQAPCPGRLPVLLVEVLLGLLTAGLLRPPITSCQTGKQHSSLPHLPRRTNDAGAGAEDCGVEGWSAGLWSRIA